MPIYRRTLKAAIRRCNSQEDSFKPRSFLSFYSSSAETPKRVVLSMEILPGKPFHVTQRREREIQKIIDTFKSATLSTVTVIYVIGAPGCGKTQLARQFVKKFLEECESHAVEFSTTVATINAQTTKSLLKSYVELYKKLEFPKEGEMQGAIHQRIKSHVEDVKNYLRKTSAVWLLIVDNVMVNDPLREFWPAPEQDSLWGKGLLFFVGKGGVFSVPIFCPFIAIHAIS